MSFFCTISGFIRSACAQRLAGAHRAARRLSDDLGGERGRLVGEFALRPALDHDVARLDHVAACRAARVSDGGLDVSTAVPV